MYLKQIEINGFKSFANKTRLVFEPGMIAIVGPNGCGKSNVSDAIRWVLGEQRPTALRCGKMADVIFNGSESRKPLGMAEVALTFADCAGVLESEFDEVTVSRRVFRSGEGQYFINKTPCRLKDVQRLFMGTGIGTTSYSVMAQGQIDAILSSKPEDRRMVFEEAAGITKFKADRKEATRKIEQTEANLLRLADVIREVKRQIGSLQRQAGKARRFKALREELRGMDIYLNRQRLSRLNSRLDELVATRETLAGEITAHQRDVSELETNTAALRERIHEREHSVAELVEQAAQADNRLTRAREIIKINQQRVREYRAWAERDGEEINEMRSQLSETQATIAQLEGDRNALEERLKEAQECLQGTQTRFEKHKHDLESCRARVQNARSESWQCERRMENIQRKIEALESSRHESLRQQDRLAAECAQIDERLEVAGEAESETRTRIETHQSNITLLRDELAVLQEERTTLLESLDHLQTKSSVTRADMAAKRAQLELMQAARDSGEEYAAGARALMDPSNPLHLQTNDILGVLADKFNASQELRLALEAALRPWLDAVVVRDGAAMRRIIQLLLAQGQDASARLVDAGGTAVRKIEPPPGLTRLLDHVNVVEGFRFAAECLLGKVFLADSMVDAPDAIPPGCSVVTREGVMLHDNGCGEVWMPDSMMSSPLARHIAMDDTRAQLSSLEQEIATDNARLTEVEIQLKQLGEKIAAARKRMEDGLREAAHSEGELRSITREMERIKDRHSRIVEELAQLTAAHVDEDASRASMATELRELSDGRARLLKQVAVDSDSMQTLEGVYNEISHALMEHRIAVAGVSQRLEHVGSQYNAAKNRAAELHRTIEGRCSGVLSYDESAKQLLQEIAELEASLSGLQEASEKLHTSITTTRNDRDGLQRESALLEARLSELRRGLDEARDRRGKAEVELTETRMTRQSRLDHLYNEYGVSEDALIDCADPVWPQGAPPPESEVEQSVASLVTTIQQLGPVNLVAVEEYKELEERYAFLKAQEDDLLKSKERVVELIATINKRSSELFEETFNQANANFEAMFTKLFNGGQAKLVLLENSEDPLESGVDIIARPPGKRPQSVTLLSGGERTMTAVSLLFAIFMIKPAPFCVLDELDATLDDSNIGRFVQTVKDFLEQSQFLIITHNQHTIAGSDIVYGVTQQEKGISSIVSMRLKELDA